MFSTLFELYLRYKSGNNLNSFDMKKLISFVLIIASVLTLASSCNKKDSEPMYVSIATLVESGGLMGSTIYVVFDNGKTAYVTNASDLQIDPPFDNEVRAMIYYTINEAESTDTGYDMVITLNMVYGIITDYVRFIDDHDIGNIGDYTAGIDINEGYYANSWITLDIAFLYGSVDKKHNVYMVYNDRPDHAGMFQALYSDDGYLYLELYHDDDDDTTSNVFSGYVCWKIRSNLDINVTDYKGIKILYWDYKNNAADVFTLENPDFENIKIAQ